MAVGAMAWIAAAAAVVPMSRLIGNLMLQAVLKFQSEIAIAIGPKGS